MNFSGGKMGPKSRPRRPIDELVVASVEVWYEYSMLRALRDVSKYPEERFFRNAAGEAFLLHARALVDFLYKDKPYPSDIIADDFLANEVDWKSVRPQIAPCLSEMRERSNKILAHLTYGRLKEAGVWPAADIFSSIHLALHVFVRHTPVDRLCQEWQELSVDT